jgi:hypothetical protein
VSALASSDARPRPAAQEEWGGLEVAWKRELRKVFKENRERHSLCCDTQLKLQVRAPRAVNLMWKMVI